MNFFETIREEKDVRAGTSKNLADAAVAEIKERIKDQIIYLKENSKDLNIKHHLKEINKENRDSLFQKLSDEDFIDFNEVILKDNWQAYLEKNKTEKLTKYEKEKVADKTLIAPEKDRERRDPAEEFKLSFRAMIDHYVNNMEMEENEKKRESERKRMYQEFTQKLADLGRNKPHVVAEIQRIDSNMFRRPDYEVVFKLSENALGSYEEGLKKYFDLKTDSRTEKRTPEIKAEIIMKDPRFRYYCALRELLGVEGKCDPQIFINS